MSGAADVRVTALWLYPIKGCAGVPVQRLELDAFGARGDRRWMVVDGDGRFLSQRDLPSMARLRALPQGDAVRLHVPGHAPLTPTPFADAPTSPVEIWGDVVQATFPSPAADRVLADFLARPCRLAWLPPTSLRPVPAPWGEPGDRVAFPDAFPFLLASEESLAALNAHLEQPVEMLRFRPGIVVRGEDAWAEDGWRRIRVGEVELDVAKPCARCAVTTVDPATGERSGKEPLRTLARVRAWDGQAWFAQNLIHSGPGTLSVGDPVRVLERGEPRPPIEARAVGTA